MKLLRLRLLAALLWIAAIALFFASVIFDIYLLVFIKPGGKFLIPYLFDLYCGIGDRLLMMVGIDPYNLNFFTGIVMFIASAIMLFLLGVTVILILRLPFILFNYLFVKGNVMMRNALAKAHLEYEEQRGLPRRNHETGDEWLAKRLEKERQEAEQKKKQKEAKKASYTGSSSGEQTYGSRTEQNHYEQETHSSRMSPEDELLIKAKAVYMVDDMNFTETYLKQMRKKLIKTFHSDNGEENDSFAQNVNLYYDILKPYAKKE